MSKENIERESACYLYCIDNAFELVNQKEFGKAAAYYENAARSLRELEKMRTSTVPHRQNVVELKAKPC
ncbi:hypothetical protein ACDI16_02065 [Oceanobacillus caeni]